MQLHGGNVYRCSKEYGIPVPEIMDFSASINPLGPSLDAVNAILGGLSGIVHYPDPDGAELRLAVSGKYGIPPESVLAGNGSTEFIYLVPRALRPGTVLLMEPGFSDYGRAAELAGSRIRRLYLDERKSFVPDMDRLFEALGSCDMAFLCNPNNPTGVLLGRDTVTTVMDAAAERGTFLVIDEAFIDYSPGDSVIADAAGRTGVVVLRNFTKFYGMPGVRSGYAAGHPDTLKKLSAHKEPWSLNSLAEAASIAAMGDDEYAQASLRMMESEKLYLFEALNKIPGLKPYAPGANFMLVRLSKDMPDASGIAAVLEPKGILIRDCSNFEGLGPEYIRVAVRTRKENELLVEALSSL